MVTLSKAFNTVNTVNHDILLHKLKNIGCSILALKWFKSYLSNRHQWVAHKTFLPEALKINTGVAEGSILGPLWFFIFINGLPHAISTVNIDMFADDTTIIHTVDTDIAAISESMNTSIVKLTSWLNRNKLVLNVKKTKLL